MNTVKNHSGKFISNGYEVKFLSQDAMLVVFATNDTFEGNDVAWEIAEEIAWTPSLNINIKEVFVSEITESLYLRTNYGWYQVEFTNGGCGITAFID